MASLYNERKTGQIVGDLVFDNDFAPESFFTTADSLIGDMIVNAQGDDLGQIEAIMLDVPNGRIAYAVLSFGGFLGFGEKRFAIPWGALVLDEDNEKLVLDVDISALKNVLIMNSRNSCPASADAESMTRMHG